MRVTRVYFTFCTIAILAALNVTLHVRLLHAFQ